MRALLPLAGFAAACLLAPAVGDALAQAAVPAALASLLGWGAARGLVAGAHKLQTEEAPREERCPRRRTS